MKTVYQLRKIVENPDDTISTVQVGGDKSTKIAIYNFAEETVGSLWTSDWRIREIFGDPDSYGVRDWQDSDWVDWKQAFEFLTA